MASLLQEALRQQAAGRKAAFVTVVRTEGSVPQVPGAKMLVTTGALGPEVHGTIGGGNLEHRAAEEALELLEAGEKARYVEKDLAADLGMACGGRAAYFIERLSPADRLLICGGGHVGLAVYRVMKDMDFAVTVLDPRPDFNQPGRFPGAAIVPSFEEAELEKLIATDERTYIVIVSRDHPTDFRLTKYFLPKPWAYLGVIASAKKASLLRRQLEEESFPKERIGRLVSPIGLPLGGPRPEEIAVSIAAQIIELRYKPTR